MADIQSAANRTNLLMEGESHISVRFQRLDKDVPIPRCSNSGYCLTVRVDKSFKPGESTLMRTDIAFMIPEGYIGLIAPQNSLASNRLSVDGQVMGKGYTGNVHVTLVNRTTNKTFWIKAGDEVAQIVFVPVLITSLIEDDSLSAPDTNKKRARSPDDDERVAKRRRRIELDKQIIELEAQHSNVLQHTAEWDKRREDTIGGSEMGALFGVPGSFKRWPDLVDEKLGFGTMSLKTHPPCVWGLVFEPVARRIAEIKFSTTIRCHKICIIYEEMHFRYSPDGLAVVSTDNEPGDRIALFEFKCPYTRQPKNIIPEWYRKQVLAGIPAVKIADIGIYWEMVFRVCQLSDLGHTPTYNRNIHPRDFIPVDRRPAAWGLLHVYSKTAKDESLIDFGKDTKECKQNFHNLLVEIGKETYTTSLAYLEHPGDVLSSCDIGDDDDTMSLIGIIPFKLMCTSHHIVKPKPNFLLEVAEKTAQLFSEVDRIKARCPDIDK